ncbi:MAG: tRNA (N(6)-L-threonylcarbamoyladenosine(37)-C(2))-methylthiotransferase MtaB [Chloroflexi bacterium]|nr:tRNA (N(6)-L-threonylcarbamoyladenosine(37)-C(2))-methylthiotransferase MtaB [Chloroflexota bacterium]
MGSESLGISVTVESLGCKLNQSEAASWARQLECAGCRLVDPSEKAQVYILNTCTLTHVADRKSRHLLRMARRRNPGALVVAAGCYVERAAQEIVETGAADLVLGNEEKGRLVELIEETSPLIPPRHGEGEYAHEASSRHGEGECAHGASSRHGEREYAPGASSPTGEEEYAYEAPTPLPVSGRVRGLGSVPEYSRTRAMVKIQDGCDEFCTYCIVPLVRGRQRSRPVADILDEVRERVAEGVQEIVLTGTQIGAYGREGGGSLNSLVKGILAATKIPRIRLTSVHPHDLTNDLLGLWQDERVCPHLHLSLQSGSDPVLKRMGRPYTAAAFAGAVAEARRRMPDVAITTDVIVGFPGESDAEFEESHLFCQRMGFARMHVFSYSPRPGTAAAAMLDQVPELVKKKRSQTMLKLAENDGRRFCQQFLGRTLPVLWEGLGKGDADAVGVWSGFTGNYIKVYARTRGDLRNRTLEVKLARSHRDGLWGEVARFGGDHGEETR